MRDLSRVGRRLRLIAWRIGLGHLPVGVIPLLPWIWQIRRLRPPKEPDPAAAAILATWCRFLDDTRAVPGGIVELGVRAGDRLICAALWAKRRGIHKPVYGFDSFAGYPAASDKDPAVWADRGRAVAQVLAKRDAVTIPAQGWLDDALFHHVMFPPVDWVRRRFAQYGVGYVQLIEGWFDETLPRLREPLSFVINDSDLYASTLTGLRCLWPRLSPGGVFLNSVHRTHPGSRAAMEEFFADGPAIRLLTPAGHPGMAYAVKEAG